MPSFHALYLNRWGRLSKSNMSPSDDFLGEYSNQQLLSRIESITKNESSAQAEAFIVGARSRGLYQSLAAHFTLLNQWPMSKGFNVNNSAWPVKTADLVISPHVLDWICPEAFMPSVIDALKPGGEWVFSFFGPRTGAQLVELISIHDPCPHFQPFYDMSDVGDHIAGLGLGNVVIDSERLNLEYTSVDKLLQDAKLIDGSNFNPQRRKTLTAKGRYQKLINALEKCLQKEGKITIEVELCYGRAVKKDASSVKVGLPVQQN